MKILESYPQTVKIFFTLSFTIGTVFAGFFGLRKIADDHNKGVVDQLRSETTKIKTNLDSIVVKDDQPSSKLATNKKQPNLSPKTALLFDAAHKRLCLERECEIQNPTDGIYGLAQEKVLLKNIIAEGDKLPVGSKQKAVNLMKLVEGIEKIERDEQNIISPKTVVTEALCIGSSVGLILWSVLNLGERSI